MTSMETDRMGRWRSWSLEGQEWVWNWPIDTKGAFTAYRNTTEEKPTPEWITQKLTRKDPGHPGYKEPGSPGGGNGKPGDPPGGGNPSGDGPPEGLGGVSLESIQTMSKVEILAAAAAESITLDGRLGVERLRNEFHAALTAKRAAGLFTE